MKIQVWKEYAGKRATKPIAEGVYNDVDRRLYGLARYLIDNGNAIEIVDNESPKPKRTRKAKA